MHSTPKLVFKLCLLALIGYLAGCALTSAYRHADWLILWEIDRYFSLTREQKASLDGAVKSMLLRHRTEALPRYEQVLGSVGERVRRGLTRDDVEWMVASYQELRADLLERLVREGTPFLTSVSEEQLGHFERELKNDHDKRQRQFKLSREERLSKRAERTVEFVEDCLGTLGREQKRRVTEMSLSLPDLQQSSSDLQEQGQQELLQMLRTHPAPEAVSGTLRGWLLFPERRAPTAFNDLLKEMRAGVKDMILAIDRTATPQQRDYFLDKLQSLIGTIHELRTS